MLLHCADYLLAFHQAFLTIHWVGEGAVRAKCLGKSWARTSQPRVQRANFKVKLGQRISHIHVAKRMTQNTVTSVTYREVWWPWPAVEWPSKLRKWSCRMDRQLLSQQAVSTHTHTHKKSFNKRYKGQLPDLIASSCKIKGQVPKDRRK